jgi:glycosyltransferase involved in cell wall biosynthesis
MKIGLDATRILFPTGEGTYTREVVRNLIRIYHDHHEFLLIVPRYLEEFNINNVRQIVYTEVDGFYRRLMYSLDIYKILNSENVDIYHNLANYGIYRAPCYQVTTVQDLLTLRFADLRSNHLQWWLYKYYLPRLLARSDRIIASSNSTQKDIDRYYGFRDNVHMIHLGFDPDIFNLDDLEDAAILDKYSISSNYIFFVGYITPKKNLKIILKSLSFIKTTSGKQFKFVIAGKRGYGSEELFQMITNLALDTQVIELGFVPDQDLAALYRQARLFVFPSIYEGFGLPVLEAMACGTPVLVSNVSSLPELVENDDYACSPHSVEQWSQKITALAGSDTAHQKARTWGLQRARKFSWEKCTREIMNVYLSILN